MKTLHTFKPINEIGSDEAIPLLNLSPTGYHVNNDALQFMSTIEAPIAVVTVCGKYRTGKSYLLNKIILNVENGFGVGPTINPCTKGIWLWKRPYLLKTEEGDLTVLILDTEGLAAFDEEANHDTKVMTLSLLISSLMIYNSMGPIDETALQSLSLVIDIANKIQQENNKEASEESIAKNFPSFLWILRDFSLKLEDSQKNPISSKQYLENSLSFQKGVSDQVESKNRIRKLFKTFFADRDCSTLVRPTEDEKELQGLATIPDSRLRKEFVQQVEQLRTKINKKIRPKLVNLNKISGSILANLITKYTDSINGGKVPSIDNAWTYICKNEKSKAIADVEVILANQLNTSILNPLITDSKQYKIIKSNILNNIEKEYQKRISGFDEKKNDLVYNSTISKVYSAFKDAYQAKCIEACENDISTAISKIREDLEKMPDSTIVAIKDKLQNIHTIIAPEITNCKYYSKCLCTAITEQMPMLFQAVLTPIVNKHAIENRLQADTIKDLDAHLKDTREVIRQKDEIHASAVDAKQKNNDLLAKQITQLGSDIKAMQINHQKELESRKVNFDTAAEEINSLQLKLNDLTAANLQIAEKDANSTKLIKEQEQALLQKENRITEEKNKNARLLELSQTNAKSISDLQEQIKAKTACLNSLDNEKQAEYWQRQYTLLKQQAEHNRRFQELIINTVNDKFTQSLQYGESNLALNQVHQLSRVYNQA